MKTVVRADFFFGVVSPRSQATTRAASTVATRVRAVNPTWGPMGSPRRRWTTIAPAISTVRQTLIGANVELQGRSATKMRMLAQKLSALLVEQAVAAFAGQIAMACYWTARESGADDGSLVELTQAAFDRALSLGA